MDTNVSRIIGEALRSLREEKHLTQAEVAAHLGKQQSFISKIELGERSLRFTEQFSYAQALHVDVDELVHYAKVRLEEADIQF